MKPSPAPAPALRRPLYRSVVLLSMATLAACGGSGGADGTTAPTPPPASAPPAAPPPPASPPPASSPPAAPPTPGTTLSANLSATDTAFPNPERGFFRWAWTNLESLSADDAKDAYDHGYRLVYAPLNLAAYRTVDLPASFLTQLETALGRARASGIKVVIRAVYNYPANETEYQNAQDATLTRVLGHIAQLKPLLQQNADVIAFVQAGFIGAWGEWHTSSNNLTATTARTQIRDALLDAVPSTRFIDVRYPPYVMAWTPTLPSLQTALQGGYRVGVHNDCFLASTTDVGTYDENATTREAQRAYVARVGELAPFGGETCNPADEASPTPRTSCDDILSEGARYKLTYLNDDYYRDLFHAKWVQNGCMPEVQRKMGYRLQWLTASHAGAVSRGQNLSLSVTVRNTGWARVYNPRGLQVLLRHRTSGSVRRLEATGADPRAWVPGTDHALALSVQVPSDLAVGSYDLLLALPDGDSRLAADTRYAIRPANADNTALGQRWEASLGAFALGTQIEVR